jgi:hypothetical protein
MNVHWILHFILIGALLWIPAALGQLEVLSAPYRGNYPFTARSALFGRGPGYVGLLNISYIPSDLCSDRYEDTA